MNSYPIEQELENKNPRYPWSYIKQKKEKKREIVYLRHQV